MSLETRFRHLATMIGGPYDGMTMAGWSLPDVIKVNSDAVVLLFGNEQEKERRRKASEVEKHGRYVAGDPFVRIGKQWHEFYGLLQRTVDDDWELPEEVAEKCESVSDGKVILVHINYEWMQ